MHTGSPASSCAWHTSHTRTGSLKPSAGMGSLCADAAAVKHWPLRARRRPGGERAGRRGEGRAGAHCVSPRDATRRRISPRAPPPPPRPPVAAVVPAVGQCELGSGQKAGGRLLVGHPLVRARLAVAIETVVLRRAAAAHRRRGRHVALARAPAPLLLIARVRLLDRRDRREVGGGQVAAGVRATVRRGQVVPARAAAADRPRAAARRQRVGVAAWRRRAGERRRPLRHAARVVDVVLAASWWGTRVGASHGRVRREHARRSPWRALREYGAARRLPRCAHRPLLGSTRASQPEGSSVAPPAPRAAPPSGNDHDVVPVAVLW